MAELTPEGLVIRRYPEIREAIAALIQQNTAAELLFDEDTVLGQIVSILSQEQAVGEEVLQYLFSSLDRDKAEGTSLDSLLYLLGAERNQESFTSGLAIFSANSGDTLPLGFIVESESSKSRFLTSDLKLLSPASCYKVTYEVGSTPSSTAITVTVNNVPYIYTTTVLPTATEIVTGLAAVISADTAASYTASITIDDELVITSDDTQKEISVEVLAFLSATRASAFITIVAEDAGPVKAPANTVNTIVSPSSSVTVDNLDDLGVGRERETDEEFRLRASRSLAVSGSSTYNAVLSTILNLPEVSEVAVEENETNSTNALGLPPHSFEVILSAPTTTAVDQTIALAIWNDKPLGIQTHGNTSVVILDSTGQERTIKFSRPAGIIIATRVTYTLYAEEIPTDQIKEVIRNAVVNYGSALSAGEDVIPKRFYGPIYDATTGVDDLIVEMQVLANSGDTPSGGAWSEASIAIASASSANFSLTDTYVL